MVSIDGTDGSAIANILDETIHIFGVEDKTIANVYEGGEIEKVP